MTGSKYLINDFTIMPQHFIQQKTIDDNTCIKIFRFSWMIWSYIFYGICHLQRFRTICGFLIYRIFVNWFDKMKGLIESIKMAIFVYDTRDAIYFESIFRDLFCLKYGMSHSKQNSDFYSNFTNIGDILTIVIDTYFFPKEMWWH